MSVICVHKDFVRCDGVTVYHRAVVFIYTRLERRALCDYIGMLELCTADRQSTFFKTDFEILMAPPEMNLKNWCTVVLILKSEFETSMDLIVNWVCESYPHELTFNYYDESKGMLICSAGRGGEKIKPSDIAAYKKLSRAYAEMQRNIVKVSKEFRTSVAKAPHKAVDILIDLAKRHKILSGHWMLLFPPTLRDVHKEKIFDYLLYCFLCNPSMIHRSNRFSAKISKNYICIGIAVPNTKAATDASILRAAGCALVPEPDATDALESNDDGFRSQNVSDVDDPEVFALRETMDTLYKPAIFRRIVMRFKLDVVSHCCIQRSNPYIRPTLYLREYNPPSRNPANRGPWRRGNQSTASYDATVNQQSSTRKPNKQPIRMFSYR